MTVSHLFAVYSGGKLSLDNGGYQTKTKPPFVPLHSSEGPGAGKGNTGGAGGGGHAGSGGRGSSVNIAGQPYGSLFTPQDYGSAGGFGKDYGRISIFF